MNISITGNYGSGKSTVAKILMKKLGMKHIYTGKIMRDLAKERGISLIELQEQAKTDSSIDKYVDARQKEIGKNEDNFIVEGHIAYHFMPKSIKVFIKVSEEEGAHRVFNDKSSIRGTEPYNKSPEETLNAMRERKKLTRERWLRDYGTDFYDMSNYDLIVDSTNITPEEVAQKIIDFVEKNRKKLAKMLPTP